MLLVLRFHGIAAPSRSPMKTSSPCSTTHEIPSRSSDIQTSRLERRTQFIAAKTAPRSEDAYLSALKLGVLWCLLYFRVSTVMLFVCRHRADWDLSFAVFHHRQDRHPQSGSFLRHHHLYGTVFRSSFSSAEGDKCEKKRNRGFVIHFLPLSRFLD
jgi:hypothetical protein